MKKFWIRTASSVLYVAAFLGTMYSGVLLKNKVAGSWIFLAFLTIIAIGCTHEFYKIANLKDIHPIKWLGYIGTISIVLAGTEFDVAEGTLYIPLAISITLIIIGMPTAAIIQLWRKSDSPFSDIGYTIIPWFYIGIPLAAAGLLQNINTNTLMTVVALVWINDACAYMIGSLIGKHKMWERHSPGKTWEGTIAGVVFACIAGVIAVRYINLAITGWYYGILLGVICGVIGTLGDLVESMLKRSVGIKDSGKFLPGHGGFLDRFDSLLILIPFATIFIVIIM